MTIPYTGHSTASTLSMRIAAGNDKIAQIDSGTGAGYVAIFSDADVELVRKNFSDPCGTVNGTTGEVTLTPTGTQSTAVAGTPAYALICNSAGTSNSAMPVVQGTAPVAGSMVLNNLSISAGETLTWNNIILP